MQTTINIEDIELSEDQQNAQDQFCAFLVDPDKPVFVLKGYAGTGKSTLVAVLLNHLPKFQKLQQLIDPTFEVMDVELTATTNKACDALSQMTGEVVTTIHSLLGLRLHTDFKTGVQSLVADKARYVYNKLIFIDEASYLDRKMLRYIFEFTKNCKIVFMGDPAQLTAVMTSDTPAFNLNYPEASLEKIMRQAAGNPIIELATRFRHAVNTDEWPDEVGDLIDGQAIQYMERNDFNEAVKAEFCRDDWKFSDSKVLAWTNKRVIEYNNFIREHAKGEPELQVGDYAQVNKQCSVVKNKVTTTYRTDQTALITHIEEAMEYATPGKLFTLDGRAAFFMPLSLDHRKEAFKRAQEEENYNMVLHITERWIDLRAVYACTVNKSQGSTYGKAFIDLDDISRCRNRGQTARMLYVAFSRARYELVLTGDL